MLWEDPQATPLTHLTWNIAWRYYWKNIYKTWCLCMFISLEIPQCVYIFINWDDSPSLYESAQSPWSQSWVDACLCPSLTTFSKLAKIKKWRQEKTREWSNFNFLSKLSYLGIYYKKICTFIFSCMLVPLGPHLVYT